MCKSPPLIGAKRGDCCEPCTALLACARVAAAGTGECGICLEPGKQLVRMPMCRTHTACTACTRRILFGTLPVLTAPTLTPPELVDFLDENLGLLLHRQECPFCRARDGRDTATKLRDIRAGGGKVHGYLKETVERGLGLQLLYAAQAADAEESE